MEGLPEFLTEEIEFEKVMMRKFFWNVCDVLNQERN
jgi:hypothetical protein